MREKANRWTNVVTGYRNKADKPKPERTLISPPNFRP